MTAAAEAAFLGVGAQQGQLEGGVALGPGSPPPLGAEGGAGNDAREKSPDDGLERRQRRLSVQVGALARGDYRGIQAGALGGAARRAEDAAAPGAAWTPFQTPLALPVQPHGTTNVTAHADPWRITPTSAAAGGAQSGMWTGSLADRIRASLAALQREQDEAEAALLASGARGAGTVGDMAAALQAMAALRAQGSSGAPGRVPSVRDPFTAALSGGPLLGNAHGAYTAAATAAAAALAASAQALGELTAGDVTHHVMQMAASQALRSPVDPSTGVLRCLACGRPFASRSALTQHLAALHHGINAPGAPTVERPQAPPSPPHKPQRRQQGSSLVVGMGEEGRDGANPSSSTASALGAGLGAGAGKRCQSAGDLSAAVREGRHVSKGPARASAGHALPVPHSGAGKGFVAGTVDAATGALLSRQPRPTRVKRGILQCTAQDLLGQALAAEARLREARDDGRRLQALVDSAHQMGTGGLLVRIKQVAAQQGMLSGAFEASMGLLEGDVLADTDAAVAPSPGKGGERERERGRDACGGPEAVLLHYLEASATTVMDALIGAAKRELDRHASQPAASVVGRVRRLLERHGKVLGGTVAESLAESAGRIEQILEDQSSPPPPPFPPSPGGDWFDLVRRAAPKRRYSIQVGALARDNYKDMSLQVREGYGYNYQDVRGVRPTLPARGGAVTMTPERGSEGSPATPVSRQSPSTPAVGGREGGEGRGGAEGGGRAGGNEGGVEGGSAGGNKVNSEDHCGVNSPGVSAVASSAPASPPSPRGSEASSGGGEGGPGSSGRETSTYETAVGAGGKAEEGVTDAVAGDDAKGDEGAAGAVAAADAAALDAPDDDCPGQSPRGAVSARGRLNPASGPFVPASSTATPDPRPSVAVVEVPVAAGAACPVCGERCGGRRGGTGGGRESRAALASHMVERHGAAAKRQIGAVLQEFISHFVMLSRAAREEGGEGGGTPARLSSSTAGADAVAGVDLPSVGEAASADTQGGEARRPTAAPYGRTPALDDAVVALMERLKYFQNRKYEQNPQKAARKKRFVVGLKEALKAARSRKVSLVVLANNVDAAAGAAGFDEQVKDLLSMAEERGFTVVYALGLKRLGRLMQFRPSRSKAPPRTTAVAVLDAGGAEDLLRAVVEGHKVAARAGEVGGATGAGDEGGTTTMDE